MQGVLPVYAMTTSAQWHETLEYGFLWEEIRNKKNIENKKKFTRKENLMRAGMINSSFFLRCLKSFKLENEFIVDYQEILSNKLPL